MSTAAVLLADLRRRGVVLFLKDGRLRYRGPAGAFTEIDREAVRACLAELLALLADLASLEADGTAALWRSLYERFPESDRERLAAEVAAGDPIGCLLALCLDMSVIPAAHEPRRGAA